MYREAVVYLPEAYFIDSNRSFPVLYAHDAQNLFSPYAPFGEWRLDEVIDTLTAEGVIEPHIVVGIDHTTDRTYDYTPRALELDGEVLGGGAFWYAELLVNQLKPYVDSQFRTRPEREHTTLMGSSLGGLVSLFIYSQAYTTFGKVGAISASLWWNYSLNPAWRWLTTSTGERLPSPDRVWIDIGGAEASRTFLNRGGSGAYTRHYYQQLVGELSAHGMQWGSNQSLGYLEDPLAEHNEPAWALRAPHILRYLLSDTRPVTLSGLMVTADQHHLTSGRACEVSLLRVEARYGDGLRLTVPPPLVTYESLTEGFEVSEAGEVTVSSDLFDSGGVLSGDDVSPLFGEIEVRFGGQAAQVQISAGGLYAPQTQLIVYAPRRPNSARPSSDQLYLASQLSEPAWRPDGFTLSSLDMLPSASLLSAVGGYDRWWALVPVAPDPSGAQGSSGSGARGDMSMLCAPECAATQLAFKITRGAWESVEGRAVGVDRDNHTLELPMCQQEAAVTVSAWFDGE
jgi:predicted alpha/beta superfamily hydrolase